MSPFARRFLTGTLGLLLVLAILLPAGGIFTARRSFPKVDGEARLREVGGPVDVYRDKFGVPHIYAGTIHDLFFAQGYVHAQDRFWQMDFWRHIGSGRLSEMFGDTQLDTDKFLRTLGWARVAQQELNALDQQSLAILDAYAQGVNAYLEDHRGSQLSLEYAILKLLNPGYRVEPWHPLHSLTWAKAMAWDLRGNMDEEIERAILLKSLTPEQLAELYPPYPADHPVIVGENGETRVENREWILENGELHDHSQLSTHPSPLSPHTSPLTLHSSPLSTLKSPPSIPFLAFMALALAPIAG